MESRGSLFSQTLLDITNTKLEELAKGRTSFEAHRNKILGLLKDPNQNPIDRLASIVAGLKACFGIAISDGRIVRGGTGNEHLEITLRNLDRFLAQAKYDPSVSQNILQKWQDVLLRHLESQSQKYQYASLYARLTTEWLSAKQENVSGKADDDVEMAEFEQVSSSNRLGAREAWEKSVFETTHVDVDAIQQLLKDLFEETPHGTKSLPNALEALRVRVRDFETKLLSPGVFDSANLKPTIESLLSSDLLDDDKKGVLKDFLNNPITLKEISDVLDRRLKSMQDWTWGNEVIIEERRQVNGSFRMFMQEDLLQAIFLQHIGLRWSVFWKDSLRKFKESEDVWKSPITTVETIDRNRREYFLDHVQSHNSVVNLKEGTYEEGYFLYNLLDSLSQEISGEEGEEEAELPRASAQNFQTAPAMQMPLMRQQQMRQQQAQTYHRTKQTARKAKRSRNLLDYDGESDDDDHPTKQKRSPMATKQKLLHLLSTDILVKTRLQGGLSCFRTQVDNLFASLPHATIQTILSYFGVSQRWIGFFSRFLAAPLKFKDDPESLAPRKRQTGTPGSHVLSEVFSELVLFCLDFQINQSTGGHILWRLGDDLWFWAEDHAMCVKSWSTVVNFTKLMGLDLDVPRTGSARMRQDPGNKSGIISVPPNDLPNGEIRWGMLHLNSSTGRFEIDQEMVDDHISELSRQLKGKQTSVFAWIQAWNSFAATFFTSNFGKPANCFGRLHVDNMLSTHERIQRKLFSSSTDGGTTGQASSHGSVIEYLKSTIAERFGVENIPDGYFYFPTELGGLEVRNPFIGLMQIRDSFSSDPHKLLEEFEYMERESYKAAKSAFENGRARMSVSHPGFRPKDGDKFFSFDEYIKHRETLPHYNEKMRLGNVYMTLLKEPAQEAVESASSGEVRTALSMLDADSKLILQNWTSMEPYWKWVAQLYGPEMIDNFGGFRIVDAGLLPIGMVSLFRSGRVKWED